MSGAVRTPPHQPLVCLLQFFGRVRARGRLAQRGTPRLQNRARLEGEPAGQGPGSARSAALLAITLFVAGCTVGGPHPEPPGPVIGGSGQGGTSGDAGAAGADRDSATPDSSGGSGGTDMGSASGAGGSGSGSAGAAPSNDECLDAGARDASVADGGDAAATDCDDDAGELR